MEAIREPTNKNDFDTQYEHVIHWLVKGGAPSVVLGYVANLYRKANRWKADKDLVSLESKGLLAFNVEDHN